MNLELYKINTFTTQFNGGNPAGVVPLTDWLPDETLQAIATENNFSETAFYIESSNSYDLRWFTPTYEIDLCGHATIATAFVLSKIKEVAHSTFKFNTRSGELSVEVAEDNFTLNMPANQLSSVDCPDCIIKGLGNISPIETYKANDYLVIVDDEQQLENLTPDLQAMKQIDARGTIVSCRSSKEGVDFISRWFGGEEVGIDEDPVTGSAHATLIPYWSKKLNKTHLNAIQVSERRGILSCINLGDRVAVTGNAILYFEGHINV